MDHVRTIGFDLGLTGKKNAPTAFAEVSYVGNQIIIHEAREFVAGGTDWVAALDHLAPQLDKVLARTTATLVAYEPAPYCGSKPVYGKLFVVRWLIISASRRHGKQVVAVQPTQAKVALVGKARATKRDMIRMAEVLGMDNPTEHMADALGVALAGERLHKSTEGTL